MPKLQERVLYLIREITGGTTDAETPLWLLRPGKNECKNKWPLVCKIYKSLTDLELPEVMPARDTRKLDGILRLKGIQPRIIEVDERQHFNRHRKMTIELYPKQLRLAFQPNVWARHWEGDPRPNFGKWASRRPPLFPNDGGRHQQRAYRDALADILPPEYGFLPTLRIADFEVRNWIYTESALEKMKQLLFDKIGSWEMTDLSKSEHQSSKMWSGRFREPLNAAFEDWQRSFPFDWRLLPQEVAASKAHARAIAAAGILTEAELTKMHEGLDAVLANNPLHAETILARATNAEDIHHFVELELTKQIGDLALKLHTGRSRNEQIATDMRLFVRDAIDNTIDGLRAWHEALTTLAAEAGDHVIPSYTHLQRAEPVLVAHWLLAYASMIERDCSRLADARRRGNYCPLGSGAVAGATLALDRTIAARELNFTAPTPNSMDATSDRDFALDFTQAIATLGIHISRFAEELTLYSTAEFGFLDLPEAFSTGSSAMPQKKNPDLTELIRGKSGRLLGAATTLATVIKGLPLAYNKDLQEGQEPVFDSADTIAGILSVLPAFTRALKFNFDRMKTAATTGYLNAMAAATYLSNKGVPFRKAHEIIGNAVRLGIETHRELDAITLPELHQLSPAFAEDFFAAITLEATLDCHDVIGGTARHRVVEALSAAKQRIKFEGTESEK